MAEGAGGALGADVVVVGGGVIGASIAYYLSVHAGRRVILCEQGSILGSGATGRSAGLVRLWTRVTADPLQIGQVSFPGDEPWVMVRQEHCPFGSGQAAGPLTHSPVRIHKTFDSCLAEDVGASVDRIGKYIVDGAVRGYDPADLLEP